MRIARYRNTRYWAVIDTEDTLVCLCVYRKGAKPRQYILSTSGPLSRLDFSG